MGIEHKITGMFHLIAVSIIITYLLTSSFSKSYAIFSILFFIVKGISFALFKRSVLSVLDAIAGIYLIFPVMGWFSNTLLNIIFIGFLVQKGVVYLFR